MPNILGIIPARKGSKRIPGKNTKELDGKPLVQYAFESAKQAKLLTRLMVCTGDENVIELARKYSIEVPFVEPEDVAHDYATDFDWISHTVKTLISAGWQPDYVVILRPTTPFRTMDDIDLAIETILKKGTDSVRSLTRVKHHPYWMKKLEGDFAKPFMDLGVPEEKLRSQDLPPLYRLNGVVDVVNVRNLSTGKLYGNSMGYILIDEDRSPDIDTLDDFKYCEYYIHQKKYV